MEKIILKTQSTESVIIIGEPWESVVNLLPSSGVVIITDDNVNDLYGNRFPDFNVISVPPGEESKTLGTAERISSDILKSGIDRSGFILAIGGGVVSDLAGFVAAIYMRGVRCGYISTSLLSQVDASTGGKTGVNLAGIKNIIGVIRQPEFVICDPRMLLTLSEDEYLSGLAELIKTAVIGDSGLFDIIEERFIDIRNRDVSLLETLVARAVKFKAGIVSEDENEKGRRRILNFGHTYGHAYEAELSIKHGFAVAAGMVVASEYSVKQGYCRPEDAERIKNILSRFGFPAKYDISAGTMEKLIIHDKKKAGKDIFFVFNKGIGDAEYERVPVADLIDFYKNNN